jgi:hypothetical protein
MAMFFDAVKSSSSVMGEYRTLPQAYPVALLFAHGTHVEAAQFPIPWKRNDDRPAGVSKWRSIG